MGKYLDIARKFEAERQAEKQGTPAVQPQASPSVTSPDYRGLYQRTAEAIAEDCWAIPPAWLLDHPDQWESIKALDDRLTTMERVGASVPEYRATLARLVKCVREAHQATQEQPRRPTVQ